MFRLWKEISFLHVVDCVAISVLVSFTLISVNPYLEVQINADWKAVYTVVKTDLILNPTFPRSYWYCIKQLTQYDSNTLFIICFLCKLNIVFDSYLNNSALSKIKYLSWKRGTHILLPFIGPSLRSKLIFLDKSLF